MQICSKFFTADFEQSFVTCVLVFAIQLLLSPSWESLCKISLEHKSFKVNRKGFNEISFEFFLMILRLALRKFLLTVSLLLLCNQYYLPLAKSFNGNFGGVNFSLNKEIQNKNLKCFKINSSAKASLMTSSCLNITFTVLWFK